MLEHSGNDLLDTRSESNALLVHLRFSAPLGRIHCVRTTR